MNQASISYLEQDLLAHSTAAAFDGACAAEEAGAVGIAEEAALPREGAEPSHDVADALAVVILGCFIILEHLVLQLELELAEVRRKLDEHSSLMDESVLGHLEFQQRMVDRLQDVAALLAALVQVELLGERAVGGVALRHACGLSGLPGCGHDELLVVSCLPSWTPQSD